MDKGDGGKFVVDGITNRPTDESFRSSHRNGFDPNTTISKGDLGAHLLGQKVVDLLGLGRSLPIFDTAVDVFGIFTKDDDIEFSRFLNGTGDAGEPSYRPHTRVKIKPLSQGDIQAPNPTAYGCRQGPFNRHHIIRDRLQRILREPLIRPINLEGFLPRIDFKPNNLALASIGLLNRPIKDKLGGPPNVRPRSVSLDKRDDGMPRDIE